MLSGWIRNRITDSGAKDKSSVNSRRKDGAFGYILSGVKDTVVDCSRHPEKKSLASSELDVVVGSGEKTLVNRAVIESAARLDSLSANLLEVTTVEEALAQDGDAKSAAAVGSETTSGALGFGEKRHDVLLRDRAWGGSPC
jgi:hypothetical protein